MSLGTMEQRTEGMKKQAQELIEQAYQRGYNAGYEKARENIKSDTESRVAELMEIGRNEAWEAAGKVIKMGEYSRKFEVFPECGDGEYPFDKVSASEAIERIHAYEEQKKQKEDSEIHVGDVIRDDDVEAVVTWCNGKDWNGFLLKGEGVGEVGQVYSCMSCNEWEKTGRHFSEITEVLKKLKGGE